ncbi:type VI secretion system Vgr family protein [sulfur-oxidizing endosymbiont of Gigantopelta aegis]|uniref:type VI secretion system Vgr family protein n=1 Tax=sulfur-oxidizing endosymbiont of Gigantopelta aegis TaxID=2794934 RepID=UPI0018DCE7F6|nr:type VI secretion system tip protein TssI/VgrG [sulfur-oxidizing endosymbiont of Gigantopelta aegis]
MQQDGTASNSSQDSSPAAFGGSSTSASRKVPANITRFTFDLIGSTEELRVLDFKGSEGISEAFEYHLTLASKNDLLRPEQFMGKSGLLTFVADEQNELLHGSIAQFEQYHLQGDFFLYRLTLVPRFWFLSKRHNQRIFQDMSIPQIIEAVFNDAGLSSENYELRLSADYSPKEYCVQYQESEFDFISRLMAENGIHYHFEHALDKHLMVIADHNGAFPFINIDKNVQYHPNDSLNADQEVINRFNKHFSVQYGSTHFRDYAFKKPLDRLNNHQQSDYDSALEDYQYPGDYDLNPSALTPSGLQKTTLKLQQHQTFREQSQLASNCQRLRAGMRYELYDNPNGQYNQQYLLTHIDHEAEQPQSLDEFGSGNPSTYRNKGKCIPAITPYKMPVTDKKPNIIGYQSSAITGPSGEEIYTNEHAQSKVQFPWDREGQQDENSSCWLRSSQTWAGKHWGSIVLPRMGQEAKVGYLHGDPDRPLITGRLYNERHKPPYALPKHKTRTTIKSNSTLGGKGYNEIRIEDRKAQEQVYFHAEKDIDIRAKNDRRDIIKHDRHLIVDNNRYEFIKDSSHHTIDNNQNEKTAQNHSIKISNNQHSKAGQAVLADIANNAHFKAGQKIILEAGSELTIKAGGGFIKIDASGVTAQGAAIQLNGGTGAGPATAASPISVTQAVEADKDKPGQVFKPIPPQSAPNQEKIAFKGEISRLLQAGNDNQQGICIPCMLQTLEKAVVPDIIKNIIPNKPEKPKQTWLNVVIKDEDGEPVPNQKFIVKFNNGQIKKGKVNDKGYAHLEPVPEGKHQIELIDVDMREWKKG